MKVQRRKHHGHFHDTKVRNGGTTNIEVYWNPAAVTTLGTVSNKRLHGYVTHKSREKTQNINPCRRSMQVLKDNPPKRLKTRYKPEQERLVS
jgi:hypothetical protein